MSAFGSAKQSPASTVQRKTISGGADETIVSLPYRPPETQKKPMTTSVHTPTRFFASLSDVGNKTCRSPPGAGIIADAGAEAVPGTAGAVAATLAVASTL